MTINTVTDVLPVFFSERINTVLQAPFYLFLTQEVDISNVSIV